MTGDDLAVLAAYIRLYGSAPKILREHAADASGHCPRCSSGGDSSGKQRSPCVLLLAARRAGTGG